MYLLGFDIGSSSVKASLVNAENGQCVASAFSPKQEMKINAIKAGWAEQSTELWWENLKNATSEVMASSKVDKVDIKAIGISYQMHGLVAVDKNNQPLRDAIIWCDSRAVEIGDKAFDEIGGEKCLSHLLNSPGNFTASKLKWVKENEPGIFGKIHKIMLPGDYIALKLTDELCTTVSGLSEGIMWDFKNNSLAGLLMDHYGFSLDLIPEVVPTFSDQGGLSAEAAAELNLNPGTLVTYRAGDQPNNAFSLNVLNPGEIAATAGTSGVVYGISNEIKYDPFSRVNTFAHVNHEIDNNRLGVLLCVNGTGILYSWIKKNMGFTGTSYEKLNELANKVPVGSKGLSILPFGNGAERVLKNRDQGCSVHGLNFNIHENADMIRAAQEGIVFSFKYGMDVMKETGIDPQVIRAGKANMFLSPIFRETLASVTGATIELYDTDGSVGAAKGAGVGAEIYKSFNEAFSTLNKLDTIEPDKNMEPACQEAYANWKQILEKSLS